MHRKFLCGPIEAGSCYDHACNGWKLILTDAQMLEQAAGHLPPIPLAALLEVLIHILHLLLEGCQLGGRVIECKKSQPDAKAAALYVERLSDANWPNPIICSAAKRGYPEILGPSGLKMNGPYDWVPPNYWYGDRLGAAFGFGSELGAGVGTPEMGSLKKFLSESDMNDLWTKPKKGLYHMSTNVSSFFTRRIYDRGLYHRFGDPTSLDDYLLKAQMMDYEATRSEYEGYAVKWNYGRPATGLIY